MLRTPSKFPPSWAWQMQRRCRRRLSLAPPTQTCRRLSFFGPARRPGGNHMAQLCSDRLAGADSSWVARSGSPGKKLLSGGRSKLIGRRLWAWVKASCHLLPLLPDHSQPPGMHFVSRSQLTLSVCASVSSTARLYRKADSWIGCEMAQKGDTIFLMYHIDPELQINTNQLYHFKEKKTIYVQNV